MNQSGPVSRRSKLQFSLRSLLGLTAGVSGFCGLIAAGWRMSAFWYLAASGFCMMVAGIVLGRGRRSWTTLLLLIGIGYAAANIGLFAVTMSQDAFTIFRLSYVIPVVYVGPGLLIIASIVVAAVSKRLDWLGLLGFVVWIGCVGFAHLWIIAECSASV